MIIASFNVEILFARAKILDNATWEEGSTQLAAFERSTGPPSGASTALAASSR